MIRGIVFDFDMTLVDSSCAMEHTLNLLMSHFKLPPVTRERLMSVIGLSTPEFFAALTGSPDPLYPQYYREHYREAEFPRLRLFPETLECVQGLRERGIRLGLASNRNNPRKALEAVGLMPVMDCVVGALDVVRPKPAPDMILKALEALGTAPEEGLYVGDTDLDALAAANAGVKSLLVRTSTPEEKLREAKAWRICDSLADLPRVLSAEGLL